MKKGEVRGEELLRCSVGYGRESKKAKGESAKRGERAAPAVAG